MPDLGHSAFPHTEVGEDSEIIYHKGMPMWAWFFGQALAANTTSGSARNVVEHAEHVADVAMEVYQKRLRRQSDASTPQAWNYWGSVEARYSASLHLWWRVSARRHQFAATSAKDKEPTEGTAVFDTPGDLANNFHIHEWSLAELCKARRPQ